MADEDDAIQSQSPKPKSLAFFSTIVLLLNSIPISSSQSCSTSSCRSTDQSDQLPIRSPFHLQSLKDPSCGSPGFTLFCDAYNRTLIELPSSGSFTVQDIDYARQNIWLNDPDNCLPRRLLKLNLSGSPFDGVSFQDFVLYRCASNSDMTWFNLQSIRCLSDESYTVFATYPEGVPVLMRRECILMATVAVPVRWDYFEPLSNLSEDMRLTWGTPRCRRCEAGGGRKLPRVVQYAIIIGAGVPALLCLLGCICFISRRMRRRFCRWRYGQRPTMEFSMAVAPNRVVSPRSGLDGPTIESYPKTTLGESCRLPNPDDNICSICLSEYMPKETLRSIPECGHCFHAECIDKWLQQKASCPVCRNSPKPSPHQ